MILPGSETRRQLLAGIEPEWLVKHTRRAYILKLLLSTPPWVDRRAITRLKREARRRTLRDGRQWVVDHIVPLTHTHVCGLTVPWNLRIITKRENDARSNRWWQFTEDMFREPQQLRLLL